MIERVTRYGRSGDPFVRITDEYDLQGTTLNISRTVVPRGYVPGIEVTVDVRPGSRARVWMHRHAPTLLAWYDAIRIDLALRWKLWVSR